MNWPSVTLLNIVFEIALAIGTFIAGHLFWQIVKRKHYIRTLFAQNQSAFNEYVKSLKTNNVFELKADQISVTGKFYTDKYYNNIRFEAESSNAALNKARNIFVLILFIILTLSFFLGMPYLLINGFILLGTFFIPISDSAKRSAVNDVRSVAWNLYHFYKSNPLECERFMKDATSLQVLYNAIKDNL